MRLKDPPQPLVFRFSGATPLCLAAGRLYLLDPSCRSSLCLYRDRYYLAVYAGLRERSAVRGTASEYGVCLGPGKVLYAFLEEHGCPISADAVKQLGFAFSR